MEQCCKNKDNFEFVLKDKFSDLFYCKNCNACITINRETGKIINHGYSVFNPKI
jgi:hypothetical protein